MNHISGFVLSLFAVVVSATCHAAPRNVVLVVTDDQSLDAGCYGNPVLETPHLDALASDGTLFTHAFCTRARCAIWSKDRPLVYPPS